MNSRYDAEPGTVQSTGGSNRLLALLILALIVGVVGSLFLYQYTREVDHDRARMHVVRALDGLTAPDSQAFMAPLLDSLFGRLHALADEVSKTETVDQSLLDRHIWSLQFFDGMFVNLEYLPRTKNDEFYLAVESSAVGAAGDSGTNYAANPVQWLAMEQARDTGGISTYAFNPQADEDRMLTRYFHAVYEGNGVPADLDDRRTRLRGFVAMVMYIDLASWGPFVPDEIRGVEAAYYPVPVGSEPAPVRGELARSTTLAEASYELQGEPRHVIARATGPYLDANLTNRPWWFLAGGLAITALLCGAIHFVRRQSNEVLRLVDARTRELNERTEALEAANKALRESEKRYRMLADNVNDVIYTTDLDSICTYISPSIASQRGFEPEELIGTNLIDNLVPESARHARQGLIDVSRLVELSPDRLGGYRVSEYDAYCKDGSVISIENTTSLLFDDDGKVIGILGVSRDVSERKRAEREKEDLEDAYRHAQKMEAIGTLAGGVAHDFNNLLTGILGYTDILKQQVDDPRMTNSLEVIEKAATRAQELTGQLLGFARKGKYQSVAVNLNGSIEDVMAFLQRTIDKSIAIEHDLSPEPTMLMGDPSQIHQLLLNLAINARDAMPGGGVLRFETRIITVDEIFCRAHPGTKPGTYNLILVSDTGVGMSKEKIERIFEPFFTDKDQGKGTGMGLAMVYGVATSHGGAVSVYSEEGMGSTFRVYLPFTQVTQLARQETRALPVHGSGNILVVDDEEILRDLANMMLGDLGYTIVTVEDGVEALEYYRDHWQEVDLAIIDMIMPRMGGVECLAGLKEINPSVKVIMSTGYSTVEFSSSMVDENVVGFLQKPFRMQEVSEVVAGAMKIR